MQEWNNGLIAALQRQGCAAPGPELASIPLAYRDQTTAAAAADDMAILWQMNDAQPLKVVAAPTADQRVAVKLYSRRAALPLSHGIEILSRFGLKVLDYRAHEFDFSASGQAWIQHFVTDTATWPGSDLAKALEGALDGRFECDRFSALALAAGLSAKEIMLLRACARFWRQIGCVFGEDDMAGALSRHPQVAAALVARFHARFSPWLSVGEAEDSEAALLAQLQSLFDALPAADDRRVLAGLNGLIGAMLRTNFYQTDAAGQDKDYLSFKFDCAAIDGLPAPRPLYEIFVYSAQMEGVHLRGGRVARGGLRWSDRLHDFRTEVLGLFKAQMVKNVVIVPEGAKGGFVVKRPPAEGGGALRREAIVCYSTLIRGLLDLTDNLVDGRVVPPPAVRRHDGDDPYLVVAADKGTATFSDIANAISADYGFWLGDAFASGGSVGYDHKALGITARGAWEAVKRHFREAGIDAQHEAIEVVGVGDMSGDVFGNGLLLAEGMRLIGAFDHRHIFVDPQPQGAAGLAERRRLFALPASSWADFDPAALGPGGAIYARSEKALRLSAETQARFGLATEATPEQLMTALLQAEVDLLWLGGIGTYVRAGDESDAAAGDRNNDAIRIAGRQLRARVVGEGANLGLTQRGRIEAALNGVALNTDAIDNAGGVSCSDHEVNIKILLNAAQADGRLSRQARDALLASMADEVCGLVLQDIKLQTQALSVAATRAEQDLDRHRRLIGFFEQSGQLDRSLAGLPADDQLATRRTSGRGLTRPELAVLLAHTKIALFAEIIDADLPADPLLEQDLLDYFPSRLREAFRADILDHPLRREIVTMTVVNSMVNRVGSGFVNDIHERTGATDAEVARAYLVARELFGLETCWAQIEALDTAADSAAHRALMQATREIVELATVWLLRHRPSPLDISSTVAELRPMIESRLALPGGEPAAPSGAFAARLAGLAPSPLVDRLLRLHRVAEHLDVIALASAEGLDIRRAETAVAMIGEALDIATLRGLIDSIPSRSPREASALACLMDMALAVPARLLRHHRAADLNSPSGQMLQQILEPHRAALALYRARCRQLECSDSRDLAGAVLLAAALREVVAEA